MRLATVRSYAALLLGTGASRILSFAAAVALARALTPEGFGEYSLFFSLLTVAYTSTWFVDWTYVRFANVTKEAPSTSYLRGSFVVKLVLFAVILAGGYPVAALLAEYAFDSPELGLPLYFAIATGSALSFVTLLAATHQAHERFGSFAALTSAFYAIALAGVLGVVLVDDDIDVTHVYAVYAVSAVIPAVLSIVRLYRLVRPLVIETGRVRQLLGFSRWLALSTAADVIGQRLDLLFVVAYAELASVGQYGAALRISGLASVLTGILPTLLLSRATRTRGSDDALRRYMRSVLWIWSALAVVIAILWVLTPLLVTHLVGEEYSDAVGLTRILLLGIAFTAVYSPLYQLFLAEDDPRKTAYLFGIRLAVLVTLLFALVPAFGTSGAAWAFAGSELAAAVFTLVAVRGSFRSGAGAPLEPGGLTTHLRDG